MVRRAALLHRALPAFFAGCVKIRLSGSQNGKSEGPGRGTGRGCERRRRELREADYRFSLISSSSISSAVVITRVLAE